MLKIRVKSYIENGSEILNYICKNMINLETLKLTLNDYQFINPQSMNNLNQLRNLQSLTLFFFQSNAKEINNGELINFPINVKDCKLKKLRLYNYHYLLNLSNIDKYIPNLTRLTLSNCYRNITKFPVGFSNLKNLTFLRLKAKEFSSDNLNILFKTNSLSKIENISSSIIYANKFYDEFQIASLNHKNIQILKETNEKVERYARLLIDFSIHRKIVYNVWNIHREVINNEIN